MLGWGAVCSGVKTGGLWSDREEKPHKLSETPRCHFAFAKDTRNALILDNSTPVFYINWMGGTHFAVLSNLVIHLW